MSTEKSREQEREGNGSPAIPCSWRSGQPPISLSSKVPGCWRRESFGFRPPCKRRDPRIFAAGDAITIFTPDGKRYTPWTWPQAVSQGKLAAANLYRSNPLPLKALTRVNSMNLQGLALNMLGALRGGVRRDLLCAAVGRHPSPSLPAGGSDRRRGAGGRYYRCGPFASFDDPWPRFHFCKSGD